MSTLAASAHCIGCDWTAAGDPADVDRQAEKHTSPGHATATAAEPAHDGGRERTPGQVRDARVSRAVPGGPAETLPDARR